MNTLQIKHLKIKVLFDLFIILPIILFNNLFSDIVFYFLLGTICLASIKSIFQPNTFFAIFSKNKNKYSWYSLVWDCSADFFILILLLLSPMNFIITTTFIIMHTLLAFNLHKLKFQYLYNLKRKNI
jgi:hypothetical protein